MSDTDDYTDHSVQQTLTEFVVQVERGLSQAQAQERLERYGYNDVPEQEESLLHRIFRRFWGPIPATIEVAAILSAIVSKWDDFALILVMLIINAGMDFFQEHRALHALKALKQHMAINTSVLRDGSFQTIISRNLVPGDIIRLHMANVIPADVQLIQGDYLLVDQSTLTGESLPVTKREADVAYASTVIKQGEMLAVVVNTGKRVNFYKVVELVARATEGKQSHFQKIVLRIGDFLISISLVLIILIIMVALFRHENFLEIARFALVLAVASIPIALPAVLSVTLAVGAINLARKKAIVSRLTAIEELAGVDVFCSDKTGTLTENIMHVAEPVLIGNHSERELFLAAALASKPENNDPIEIPIFRYIKNKLPDLDWQSYHYISYIPFDPIRKCAESRVTSNGKQFVAVKGATQKLLEMATISDENIHHVIRSVDQLASKGYRTLAVGWQVEGAALEFLGLIPLYDPPREDSKQIIAAMQNYGVQVKMVTGDNIAIAREIGKLLGLNDRTLRPEQLSGTAGNQLLTLASILSAAIYQRLKPEVSNHQAQQFAEEVMETVANKYDTRLLEREFVHTHESAIIELIESADIFAEVVPEDKYHIVDTLQKGGHIVGMTGDGVNDAPALRKADCGIAVSDATDAARAAADVILTAPGLGVISEAIEQARITFERMKSYALYRISETLRIIIFMALSIIVFDFYPITALMIILLAVLNDIPILAIAYDNTQVDPKPVRWVMSELLTISSVLGISGVISSFLMYFLLREYQFSVDTIRTFLFLKLIIAGHTTLYITRARGWFWQRPWPSLLLLIATFSTEILGTLIAVYGFFVTPIGWANALLIWTYALVWFVFNDSIKMGSYWLLKSHMFL